MLKVANRYTQWMNNNENVLSEETLQALEELGEVLLEIHNRMISEEYAIKDGRIYKVETEHCKKPPEQL